jgi:hypothetical protein
MRSCSISWTFAELLRLFLVVEQREVINFDLSSLSLDSGSSISGNGSFSNVASTPFTGGQWWSLFITLNGPIIKVFWQVRSYNYD